MNYQKNIPFLSNSIPQNSKFLDHIVASFFAELWVKHSMSIGVDIISPKKLHTVVSSFYGDQAALDAAYSKVSEVRPHANIFTASFRTMLQVTTEKRVEIMAMLGNISTGLNFNLAKIAQKSGAKSERALVELNNAIRTVSKMIRLTWVDDKELFEMLAIYMKYVVRRTYSPLWNTILVERYIQTSGFLGRIESGRWYGSEDLCEFLKDYDHTLLRCMTAKLIMMMTSSPKIEKVQGLMSNTRYAPIDIVSMFRVMDMWGEAKNQLQTRLKTAIINTFTRYSAMKQEIADHAKEIVGEASFTGSGVPELALATKMSDPNVVLQLVDGKDATAIASLLAVGHYKLHKDYYVKLISTAMVVAADSFCTINKKHGMRNRLVRQLRKTVQSKALPLFEQSGAFNTVTMKVSPITCIGEYYKIDLFELGGLFDLKDLLKQKVI